MAELLICRGAIAQLPYIPLDGLFLAAQLSDKQISQVVCLLERRNSN
ncbi:MAG: hypothetical protein ACFB0E_11190 [Leptolyngbyaceae cyanobacterium]